MMRKIEWVMIIWVVFCLIMGALVGLAHAHESECSSATQRDAMAEYDTIAGMVGIPAGAPIYMLEKRQYVAAVCLHETLKESAPGGFPE
jgi:hypothetical protein